MITRLQTEIIQLHQFFQDWFNGELLATDENFSRCANVLSPDFTIIPPSGQIIHRDALLESLSNAHHSHTEMRIWIENIQVRDLGEDILLATYEEWQQIEGQVTARLSSALFRTATSSPNKAHWLHVHETWITPKN